MKYTRDKYFLLENDVVVLRNGDRGIVTKDNIILQSGLYFFRHIYEKKNKFSLCVEGNKYDIVKIYHNYNDTNKAVFFNLADNNNFLVWEEENRSLFPVLENGDVVILNNDNVYMKVDHIFINQLGGYMNVNNYDDNGELLDEYCDDNWDIKKVYRNKDKRFYDFNIKHFKDTLIWERC